MSVTRERVRFTASNEYLRRARGKYMRIVYVAFGRTRAKAAKQLLLTNCATRALGRGLYSTSTAVEQIRGSFMRQFFRWDRGYRYHRMGGSLEDWHTWGYRNGFDFADPRLIRKTA